ncbi:hypothetical protein A8990_10157 [Paenibacillus taihuensis]|uniref:Nucleotidyltransferase AbiEii toxin of type IV toxin-antitoxin system n=1 Tax=Paenibacillus taihuensis TaxID=1156355 RepID=A0A3D9SED0_9BACL|nr:hypothetical protein [Paenibacillus taihuensis]REE94266.1 hypothetical protein A8990_10157 [Paenibacillus taihuensis]
MNDAAPFIRALEKIAEAAAGTEATWLIGGSTGLLLRGIDLETIPRDLDLYADDADAVVLHQALLPYAIDEQHHSVSPIYRSVLSHYLIEGIQVELVGGFVVTAGEDCYKVEVRDMLAARGAFIEAGAYRLGIVPLAHELWFNVLRDREDRVALIASQIRQEPDQHAEAVHRIASRNQLSARTVANVQRLIEQ